MTTTRITVCAVPAPMWAASERPNLGRPGIGSLVWDAMAIERRMKKGVNLEDERTHYSLCCARMEAITSAWMQPFESEGDFKAILDTGRLPASVLDATYLDVLREILDEDNLRARADEIRLGATFFPPESVRDHAVEFRRLADRLGRADNPAIKARVGFFLDLALPAGCGVVEVQSAFYPTDPDEPGRRWELAANIEAAAQMVETVLPSSALIDESHEPPTGDRDELMRRNLRARIRRAMAEPDGSVNFSNYGNHIIAQILHEFVYHSPRATDGPFEIRVLYADGSEGDPFPLRCLTSCEAPEMADTFTVRAALMSMRHLEMDREVDMAWFRNREVSKSRTLAESDKFCYAETLKQFRQAAEDLDTFLLDIYQTGFQPAVIGFYRGLVRTLSDIRAERTKRLRALVVRPYLYRAGSRYEQGPTWC